MVNSMRMIKVIGSMVLLLVLLFSTTGISFYYHECLVGHHTEVSAYPEFDAETMTDCCSGCCCAAASGETFSDSSGDGSQLSAAPCCIKSYQFLRLVIDTDPGQRFASCPVIPGPAIVPGLPIEPLVEPVLFTNSVRNSFHSPPPDGWRRIDLFHQRKAPPADPTA